MEFGEITHKLLLNYVKQNGRMRSLKTVGSFFKP